MSHTQVQWARGTSAQAASYTGPAGEIVVDTDDYSLVVQDGATAGGHTRLAPTTVVPQGRLTLTSNAPVMTSDVTAAPTVYYTPYIGHWCPVYNGFYMVHLAFGQISLALDSNSANSGYQAAGGLYDIFAYNNAGALALGTGPAWSSSTARGSGGGTTQLQMLNGIWTNANAITLHTGVATSTSVAANQATYLGTLYATANGQTAMQFAPAAAAGGGNPVLGLYNAYNRVRMSSRSMDSTGSWTYASATPRPANNSTANRVTWIDGLGQSTVEAACQVVGENNSGGAQVSVAFDTTTAQGTIVAYISASTVIVAAYDADRAIALGLHYAQAIEASLGGTLTIFGAGYQQTRASLEM